MFELLIILLHLPFGVELRFSSPEESRAESTTGLLALYIAHSNSLIRRFCANRFSSDIKATFLNVILHRLVQHIPGLLGWLER